MNVVSKSVRPLSRRFPLGRVSFLSRPYRSCQTAILSNSIRRRSGLALIDKHFPCLAGTQFAQSRSLSSHDYGEGTVEVPDSLHSDIIEYGRCLVRQYEELRQHDELSGSKYHRILNFLLEATQSVKKWDETQEHMKTLQEMLSEPDFRELAQQELEECKETLAQAVNEFAGRILPAEETEDTGCMLEIRGGAGGAEAYIFAQELFVMYQNLVQYRGGRFDVTYTSPAQLGGYREATALVDGRGIYSLLKYECGVHRVQRVPATETMGRRHTSTVGILILPQPKEVDVQVLPKDLKMEVCRAGGAGGQYVNTTDSAVRLTHLPSGLAVRAESSRTQTRNRESALILLKAKLHDIQQRALAKENRDNRRSQITSLDRSEKIRTFHYFGDQVVDHRFDLKTNKVESVLSNPVETDQFLRRLAEAARLKSLETALEAGPPDYVAELLKTSDKPSKKDRGH